MVYESNPHLSNGSWCHQRQVDGYTHCHSFRRSTLHLIPVHHTIRLHTLTLFQLNTYIMLKYLYLVLLSSYLSNISFTFLSFDFKFIKFILIYNYFI
jgi:hypothetical protein